MYLVPAVVQVTVGWLTSLLVLSQEKPAGVLLPLAPGPPAAGKPCPPIPILSDSVASGFFWYKAAQRADGCKDAAGWQEGKGEWGEPQPALWFAKRQDTPPPTPPTPPVLGVKKIKLPPQHSPKPPFQPTEHLQAGHRHLLVNQAHGHKRIHPQDRWGRGNCFR